MKFSDPQSKTESSTGWAFVLSLPVVGILIAYAALGLLGDCFGDEKCLAGMSESRRIIYLSPIIAIGVFLAIKGMIDFIRRQRDR
ncbi:hypothetical protein [uncultured Parasphingopyxis sp.]|uniref:hypothetical protein n=1 Tax=uncultured Parasphingopyxis sp. TaxID=1547918 RepID=UPI002606B71C|nr:hypothetical protein [uncultured Parasphingopyxis sp.]